MSMPPSTPSARRLPARLSALLPALLLALVLAGCATFAPEGTPTDVAFVVVGEDGAATARVITTARSCPPLLVDNRAMPMRVRVPHGSVPARPGQPHTPPSTAVLTCVSAMACSAVAPLICAINAVTFCT